MSRLKSPPPNNITRLQVKTLRPMTDVKKCADLTAFGTSGDLEALIATSPKVAAFLKERVDALTPAARP